MDEQVVLWPVENGNGADNAEDDPSAQESAIHSYKIGVANMDIWNMILEKLSDFDLAHASLVCKDFQLMSEDIFKKRYDRKLSLHAQNVFYVMFTRMEWKPVILRFRKFITEVSILGPATAEGVISQSDFTYFEKCLSENLKSIRFYKIKSKQWNHIAMRHKFPNVENLVFQSSDLSSPAGVLSHFAHWYPNLKSLTVSQCSIGKCVFLEQRVPSIEKAAFFTLKANKYDFFLVFIIKNRHLKHLYADLSHFEIEDNMDCLPIVNELLPDLESLNWVCQDLSKLPTFRSDFFTLKKFIFVFTRERNLANYKNELMSFIRRCPVLETLHIILINKNLMTNDDLVDLLTEHSTLKELRFISREMEYQIKFGYDLQRRVAAATSNRSDVLVDFVFGFGNFASPQTHKRFLITKDWIKENGQYLVERSMLDNEQ